MFWYFWRNFWRKRSFRFRQKERNVRKQSIISFYTQGRFNIASFLSEAENTVTEVPWSEKYQRGKTNTAITRNHIRGDRLNKCSFRNNMNSFQRVKCRTWTLTRDNHLILCEVTFLNWYVKIKGQLDATQWFLLQNLLSAQHVSETIMPIIGSSRVIQMVAACGTWRFGLQVVGLVWSCI